MSRVRISIVALLLVPLGALTAADQPAFTIPHGEDAPVKRMLFGPTLAWNRSTMDAVLQDAPDAPGKAEALAAFALVGRAWSGESIPKADLAAKVEAAVDAGSQDAMVQYLSARFSDDGPAALAERYRAAHAALADSPYPRLRRAVCAARIFECLARAKAKDPAALTAARDQAARELLDALTAIPNRERGACQSLLETVKNFLGTDRCGDDPEFGARFLHDLDGAPIAPWWRDMAAGVEHIKLAWSARGSGWANTVSDEGWQGFRQHLAAARDNLAEAWKLHPERPEAAVEMITVAMGGAGGDADARTWFERAVAAQMDCIEAYDRLSFSLRPRWGGSHEAMLALGEAAADTARFDTEVPWQYIVQVCSIYGDARGLKDDRPELLDAKVYARCRAILDSYRRAKGATEMLDALYASQSAVVAWACGLPEEALAQLDAAGDHVAKDRFGVLMMSPEQLRHAANAAIKARATPPKPPAEAKPADPPAPEAAAP